MNKEKTQCIYAGCHHPQGPCLGHCDLDVERNQSLRQPDTDADLICEALVREIGRSDNRWMAIVEAWQALLNVRRMQQGMDHERAHLAGTGMQSARSIAGLGT